MSITIVKRPGGSVDILTASEPITDGRTLRITDNKTVGEMASGYIQYRIGVARGDATSGSAVKVVTHGIMSGVILASGGVIPGSPLQADGGTGYLSGTGFAAPLISGVGALLGNAINSGGRGSGIAVMVAMG